MFKDHPKGLIPAALSNMGERFGYYIMNAVLVLFLCSKFGLSDEASAIIYSVFYCGIYVLSLVGGIIADRTQNYKAVIRSGLIEEVESRHLTISWTSFALAVLVGTVVTLVSVLRPARQASRVSALVALTGQTAGHESLGRRRVAAAVAGVVVAALGLGLIHGGVTWRVLEMIGTGAVVAVLGIILALPLLVVGASRLVGSVCGQEGRPILHLATRNLARHPARTAATTASLLVAVAVAAAMSSGLSSVASSMQTYVGYHTPVDITVGELSAGQDPSSTVARIAAVDGVEGVVPVPRLEVTMTGGRRSCAPGRRWRLSTTGFSCWTAPTTSPTEPP